jgi:hypothetical protein
MSGQTDGEKDNPAYVSLRDQALTGQELAALGG